MAFKPGFDQSPAFNNAGRNAFNGSLNGAPYGQQPAAGQQYGAPYGQQAPNGRAPYGSQPISPDHLENMYDRPAAGPVETERMTYEDTIVKTLIAFGVLVVGAVIAWNIPALALVGGIVGFVLALVNTFKKKPSPTLVLLYAGMEGLFVGGISAIFNRMPQLEGIVGQAVFGTLGVFAVTLILFCFGKVRASARATKIFIVALIGYAAFSLVNLVLMWTGVTQSAYGLRSVEIFGIPLGVILGILVVIMAAYSLVLDFDRIKTGVQRGAPRIYAWTAAFGLIVTLVWLYLEVLRLLAILRGNN
ncbi:Bax inhibitor-1/YccA family protein [Curtobacterium sp. RRHDQ10]|uniref:Bax inhibitor-1/YccA family protein n=1 Tax=Curtobacterium phyllosphaerae TaxID=3413379 RepID=UPI003BF3EA40